MPASSFLLVDHIRLSQFRISLKRAPGFGSEVRADQVGEMPAWSPILEQNQERHSQRGHDELHKDVERNAEYMRVAIHEVGKEVHRRGQREHQNQVLKLQTKERHLGMEVAVNLRHIETHGSTLRFRALASPSTRPGAPFPKPSVRRLL